LFCNTAITVLFYQCINSLRIELASGYAQPSGKFLCSFKDWIWN
jgi:hypothetical protein